MRERSEHSLSQVDRDEVTRGEQIDRASTGVVHAVCNRAVRGEVLAEPEQAERRAGEIGAGRVGPLSAGARFDAAENY